MAGLKGENPDEAMAKSDDYSDGWLAGATERDRRLALGVAESEIVPKYLGPCAELPLKRGDEVFIPKGTTVNTIHYGERHAGRAYKVKLHDIHPGMPAYRDFHSRDAAYIQPPTTPKLLWAGTGGYWSEADLNEVLAKSEVSK